MAAAAAGTTPDHTAARGRGARTSVDRQTPLREQIRMEEDSGTRMGIEGLNCEMLAVGDMDSAMTDCCSEHAHGPASSIW